MDSKGITMSNGSTPTVRSTISLDNIPIGFIPTLTDHEVLLFINEGDSSISCACFRDQANHEAFISGSIIFGSICSAAVSLLRLSLPGPPISPLSKAKTLPAE